MTPLSTTFSVFFKYFRCSLTHFCYSVLSAAPARMDGRIALSSLGQQQGSSACSPLYFISPFSTFTLLCGVAGDSNGAPDLIFGESVTFCCIVLFSSTSFGASCALVGMAYRLE